MAPPELNLQARPKSIVVEGRPVRTRHARGAWTFHRSLVVAGLALCILSPLAFFSIEAYLFTALPLVPSVLALFLIVFWSRPWTYLAAALLGALFPIFVVLWFGLVGGALADPIARAEFLACWMNLLGLVALQVGGIGGYNQGQHGRPAVAVRAGWSTGAGTAVLLAVFLFAGSVATSTLAATKAASADGGWDFAPEARVTAVTQGTKFVPSDLTVPRNAITEISIQNRDAETHTFTYVYNGQEYEHEILGGTTTKFLVRFAEAGSFRYWCAPHSNGPEDDGSGMIGNLILA